MSVDTKAGIFRYLAFTLTPIIAFAVLASLWPFLFWYLFGAAFFCVFFLFHWTESLTRDWRKLHELIFVAADKTAAMGFPPYSGPGMIVMKMQRNTFPRMMYAVIIHHNASCVYQGWNAWSRNKIPESKKIMKRTLKHWQVS